MKKDGSKNFLIGIVGVIVVLFALLQVVSNMASSGAIAAESVLPASLSQNNQKPTGDDFYKAATGQNNVPESIKAEKSAQSQVAAAQDKSVKTTSATGQTNKPAVPAKKVEQKTEEFVTVSVTGNVGRNHPFLPAIQIDTRTSSELPKLPYSTYPQPPVDIQENPEATKLMQTTISGIMYDSFAPSAIISVEGQDHLVRKGDRINGYRVLDITKNRVVVQNGTNIYRATVGETLTTKDDGIIFNNVDNLRRKFAGANVPDDVEMIHIN